MRSTLTMSAMEGSASGVNSQEMVPSLIIKKNKKILTDKNVSNNSKNEEFSKLILKEKKNLKNNSVIISL